MRVHQPQRAAQPTAAWSATISADDWDGDVLVKAGQAGWTDCRDDEGYGQARAVDENGTFQLPVLLPNGDTTPDGVYILCAATAGPTGVVATGSAGYALIQIDGTPPDLPIELRVVADPGGDASVEPIFAVPEHSSFDVKAGPRDETDCDDPDGYVVYRRIPIVVPADHLPAVACVIGEDEAGNRGEPQRFDVP